ncbi:concanavalin A-like lectin/glucanase [Didymella exigua CBS 183.55]|uniref:Concanavalin A-like lectin/glucanase n=1 Tax=Didymella exigua CBS 183.55 TaxID=1150837 RepID=A0A6A5RJL8_9PLEO|nr:concanavalin A-like lectin/glucanase [Didymella exigua CBS 183.55]KAF1925767.1 concanavalin A-like lectin/glucanase [Didymella exigua CBS 183.55]
MYITPRTLQAVAWSTLAVSAARAQYVIDSLSFGHKDGAAYISPDLRTIPHFSVLGVDDYTPQILSDRVILTPPYPGSKRGALWASDPMHHGGDWTAELDFRATGMERGGGSLQLWYVKDSQAHDKPNSLYTVPKFDGLVLVIDQYEGHGGSVRGFLNDGTKDYKSHNDPDQMAFGKCDYAYRNRGYLSSIRLQHTDRMLDVIVDGESCFKTDKVKLPQDYYFGISAASAENPDSFEVHKFIVSTTTSHTREEPVRERVPDTRNQQHQQPVQNQPHQESAQQQHAQQQHAQQNAAPKKTASSAQIPPWIEDVLATNLKTDNDRFEDLHNRIQDMAHHVAALYTAIESIGAAAEQRHNDLLSRLAPLDDRSAHNVRLGEGTQNTVDKILRDLESKDYKESIAAMHRRLEDNHKDIPNLVQAVVQKHGLSWVSLLAIAFAVQVMVVGAYLVYKKRRGGAPKKYL